MRRQRPEFNRPEHLSIVFIAFSALLGTVLSIALDCGPDGDRSSFDIGAERDADR